MDPANGPFFMKSASIKNDHGPIKSSKTITESHRRFFSPVRGFVDQQGALALCEVPGA